MKNGKLLLVIGVILLVMYLLYTAQKARNKSQEILKNFRDLNNSLKEDTALSWQDSFRQEYKLH